MNKIMLIMSLFLGALFQSQVVQLVDSNSGELVNYQVVSNYTGVVDGVLYAKKKGVVYKRIISDYIDASWFGVKGDGVTDDSDALQKAFDTKLPVKLKNTGSFYLIKKRLRLYNSLIGINNPVIKVDSSVNTFSPPSDYKYGRYSILNIINYRGDERLIVSGLVLDGSWNGVSKVSEFEPAIYMASSKNVTIKDNFIKNTLGDGILLYWYKSYYEEPVSLYNENIVIENNNIVNTHRCNIAVISAKDVVIRGNKIDKQNDYVAPIDIEPDVWDHDGQLCENILIEGNYIKSSTTYQINILGVREAVKYLKIKDNDLISYNSDIVGSGFAVNIEGSYGPISNVILDNNRFDTQMLVRVSGSMGNNRIRILNNVPKDFNKNRGLANIGYCDDVIFSGNYSNVNVNYYVNVIVNGNAKNLKFYNNTFSSVFSNFQFVENCEDVIISSNNLKSVSSPVYFTGSFDNKASNVVISSNIYNTAASFLSSDKKVGKVLVKNNIGGSVLFDDISKYVVTE
ncbi:hypothetical protein [Elizabethkingia meningoseptica]|uniref:hypothetical protein n=1 Tax=Elizabethkingia meningoseptica TaxID=238 RepID=UPI003158B3D9